MEIRIEQGKKEEREKIRMIKRNREDENRRATR